MLSSRKLDELEAAAAEHRRRRRDVFAANAGDLEAAEACVAATIERFGRLDILVNNAATNPYTGPTMDVDRAATTRRSRSTCGARSFWSQAAWQASMKDNGGVIINIASVGGLRSERPLGIYNLTKAALIHLTRQLGGRARPEVRVVGIAPGLVKTDFAAMLVDNFGETLARSMPTRRLGEPEDIANLGDIPRQRPRVVDHRRDLCDRRWGRRVAQPQRAASRRLTLRSRPTGSSRARGTASCARPRRRAAGRP